MTQEQLQKVTVRLNGLLNQEGAHAVEMFLHGHGVWVIGIGWTEAAMQLTAHCVKEDGTHAVMILTPAESDQVCAAIVVQA